MTDKNYMKLRFKCRCYEKDNTVKIYDNSEILFDVSYRDYDDAYYLSRKLQSVIGRLNELYEENQALQDLNNQELQAYEDKIKGTIREYLETERTEIGKNVLKQLYEAIQ